MSQLYARVFTQILDSSIAEDFRTRHIFEDLLKVCTTGEDGGIVDMTREALARRFNVPLKELSEAIDKLESPDPRSRDQTMEGRRLTRLDDHRDWGWQIVNWKEYDKLRTRAEVAARVARHRAGKNGKPEKPESPDDEKPPDITAIYEAYPRRVGRPKALSAIEKAVDEFGYELVLEKTKSYAVARAGEDPQFTPLPATWFNQHRFNDDPSTWKNTTQKPPDPTDRNANNMNSLVGNQYANVGKAYPTDAEGNPLPP